MTDISEIIDTIAAAVEEQSVSTKNIAKYRTGFYRY